MASCCTSDLFNHWLWLLEHLIWFEYSRISVIYVGAKNFHDMKLKLQNGKRELLLSQADRPSAPWRAASLRTAAGWPDGCCSGLSKLRLFRQQLPSGRCQSKPEKIGTASLDSRKKFSLLSSFDTIRENNCFFTYTQEFLQVT